MKHSEEEIDIMLFDYLEGNLPGNELQLVNLQIAEDPAIQEELALWKSSYIQPDYYDTSGLELTLVQRSVPVFKFNFYLNSILFVCIAVFTGTKINTHGLELNTNQTQLPMIESISPKIVTPSMGVLAAVEMPPQNSPAIPVKEYEKLMRVEFALNVPETVWPSLAAFESVLNVNPIENKAMDSMQMSPTFVKDVKKMDRKSIRANQRMQRKAEQNKLASEFLKGNVPYVVPVDTQNF